MADWQKFLEEVDQRLVSLDTSGCNDPFFRGHADAVWKLRPTLARQQANPRFNDAKEARLFWEFRMSGSHLLPAGCSNWTVLYFMQHFGLPTRLLDWTTSFAHALFFALREPAAISPTVFIMNPYELNSLNPNGSRSVANLNVVFQQDYSTLLTSGKWPRGALAVAGDASIERVRHQKGAFTVHGGLTDDIEQMYSSAITKHVLPSDAKGDAENFIRLAGVDEFTIYPDLDGLARSISRRELGL